MISSPLRQARNIRSVITRLAPIAALLGLGAGLAALSGPISPSVMPATPEDLVVVLVWWAALSLGLWWVGSISFWLIALRGRANNQPSSSGRSRLSLPGRLTLPGTRKLAEGLLAIGLIALPACSPSEASAPTMVLVNTSPEPLLSSTLPSTTLPSTTLPSTTLPRSTLPPTTLAPSTLPSPVTSEPVSEGSALPDQATQTSQEPGVETGPLVEHQVMVRPGDNLWSLSVDALQAHLGTDPTLAEVGDYWQQVVAGNRVRSGNPNLIVPGEMIFMPGQITPEVAANN